MFFSLFPKSFISTLYGNQIWIFFESTQEQGRVVKDSLRTHDTIGLGILQILFHIVIGDCVAIGNEKLIGKDLLESSDLIQ